MSKPTEGGSYIRMPDGTLKRTESTRPATGADRRAAAQPETDSREPLAPAPSKTRAKEK